MPQHAHFEPPAVLTRPPAPGTPDPPPSPPPPSHHAESHAEPEDPFHDPPAGWDGPRILRDPPARGEESDQRGARKTAEEAAWRRNLREWRVLLLLENSGSVARDHLASERTFLAYVRTSLTMASMGVALVQLFSLSAATVHRDDLERYARPLGATMIGIGLYTLGVGVVRYFLVQESLVRGVYPVSRVSAPALAFAVLVMIVTVLIVVLTKA